MTEDVLTKCDGTFGENGANNAVVAETYSVHQELTVLPIHNCIGLNIKVHR